MTGFHKAMDRVTVTEEGAPPQTQQAQLVYDRWMLDVPKLLDIAALYGTDNLQLTREFMSKVFTLQPKYGNDLADLVPTLVSNFMDVRSALQEAAQRLRTSSSDSSSLQSLLDGLSYWEDVTHTLSAFVEVFPPSAGLLLQSQGLLLVQLILVHSGLIPDLQRGLAASLGQSPAAAKMWQQLARLKRSIQKLTYGLLFHAYLNSGVQSCLKCKPSWGSNLPQTAAARGSALMAVLSEASEHDGSAEASLLLSTSAQFHMDQAVSNAIEQRHITLDTVQQDYLMVLLGSNSSGNASCAATNGHAGPSGTTTSDQQLKRKTEQIRELFPEYGAGFLAACLSSCGHDAERVIHQLLEGSLPPELSRLDPKMPLQPVEGKGKGKAKPDDNGHDLAGSMSELSWRSLNMTEDGPWVSASAAAQRPPPAPAAASRPVHRGISRFLDRTGNEDRAAIKLHAKAAEFVYEDEYDDSYDDLGGGGADGIADVEGDDEEAVLMDAGLKPGRGGPQGTPSRGPSPGRQGPSGAASSSGPPPPGQAQRQKPQRTWLLDGKLYNYPKPGAIEFKGKESAAQAQQAAIASAEEIHGLGRGGNVPSVPADSAAGQANEEASGAGKQPGQQQRPSGQPGRGMGRGSHAFKDKHKAAIANHHRKDRALRKMGPPA
ncbi:g1304 [Coccomyxa elongata]